MKKFLAVVIAVVMTASLLTFICSAQVDEVKNIVLTEDGMLTWDKYKDYTNSWLEVDIYSVPFSSGNNVVNGPEISVGEHKITISIYTDDGSETVAESSFYINYDGDKYAVIDHLSETEPETETEEQTEKDTTDYGDGVIKNVNIDRNGILTWDPYDKADKYWLGIDGGYIPAESGVDLKERITEQGVYLLQLDAYAKDGDLHIASWSAKVISGKAGFVLRADATESDIVESGAAVETGAEQNETEAQTTEAQTTAGNENTGTNNTAAWLIPVLCAVIAVMAGVIVFMIVKIKKK